MTIRQYPARQGSGLRAELELVPPLAEKFAVYGNADTKARAREWALGNRYMLCQGVPACAHGMYLFGMCPNHDDCREVAKLDHADLWVPAKPAHEDRPFLLHHPYHDKLHPATEAYAKAHGLTVDIDYPGDQWYGSGTIAVRLTIPGEWPLWPIEREAAVLLSTQPVRWPEDDQ